MDSVDFVDYITSIEYWLSDSVLYVYDGGLDYFDTGQGSFLQAQGFSGYPRGYKFFTIGECFRLKVMVRVSDLANSQAEIVLRNDTLRAVMVPFSVSDGIKIKHVEGVVELRVRAAIPKGEYALVFEIKLRDDEEYLNSSTYQEYADSGFTEEYCYLTFYPREEPVLPQILRADTFDVPPTFNRYTPVVATTEPLILDDEPTQELRW